MIAPIPGFASMGTTGTAPGFNLPGAFPLAAGSQTGGVGASGAASDSFATSAAGAVGGVGSSSFGQILADKLGQLDSLARTSDSLAVKSLTGDATDVHEYTIAANQTQLATQLTVGVRNKAVEAFNEIMRMSM